MPKNLVKMHDRQTTMNFLRSEESGNLFPTNSDHSKIHLIAIDLITGNLNDKAVFNCFCPEFIILPVDQITGSSLVKQNV